LKRFEDTTAVVTGAAGNLGRAVAGRLAREGASLILMDRDGQATENLSAELDGGHIAVKVDLTDREAVAAGMSGAGDKLGPIDVVCAIAGGFSMGKPVHETEPGDWQAMQDMNVATLLSVLAAATPDMIARRSGRIVTVGAFAALAGKPHMGPYGAAKSTVMRVTESAAAELKAHGINVNAVLPSILDTPENREAMPDADPRDWVSPQSLAAVIAFLASPEAEAINGALIPVTGRV
jgi:NAD(P)-dependent dehydrogenase (short-subunit alcohol dehydrogenase family)